MAVVASEADLQRFGFGPERHFEALLAFLDGEPAGFALFHPRFSTWLGRPGVYLEDLFVTQAARGKGVGRRLMIRLAAIAVERGIAMPSFFGFMVWSAAVLLPVFAIGGYVFFG